MKKFHPELFLLVGILAWILVPAVQSNWCNGNLVNTGLMGDMFGSVNALFSLFGFFFACKALISQQDELRLSRWNSNLRQAEKCAEKSLPHLVDNHFYEVDYIYNSKVREQGELKEKPSEIEIDQFKNQVGDPFRTLGVASCVTKFLLDLESGEGDLKGFAKQARKVPDLGQLTSSLNCVLRHLVELAYYQADGIHVLNIIGEKNLQLPHTFMKSPTPDDDYQKYVDVCWDDGENPRVYFKELHEAWPGLKEKVARSNGI